MSIKLVAIDIDGTLLNDQREITPQVFKAIQDAKKQGIKIVLATGRPLSGVKALLKELNLDEEGHFAITFNGGLVQDTASGKQVVSETMTYEDFTEIEAMSRLVDVHMHAITMDGIYTPNRNIGRYTVYESNLVDLPIFYRTPEEMSDKSIVKMMYIDEPALLDAAIGRLPREIYQKYNIFKSSPFYLEIMKKNVSKGEAVLQLAKHLGLSINETMAIGDEENDRSMLEVVGHPVVMENGQEALKRIAKYITKTNNESGVAYALREWVLN